jgi:hypothetical protein
MGLSMLLPAELSAVLGTHEGMLREDDPALPAQKRKLSDEQTPPCKRHVDIRDG